MTDRFRLLLHLTIGMAIVSYGVAEQSVLLGATALAVWGAAWPISLGSQGRPLPRMVIGLLVLGATALMLLRLIEAPHNLVSIVSQYLLWMQLIKMFDRVGLRDEAQLLAMSMALVIGATLTSNRLLLGMCLLVYGPMALWTAAQLQMRAGRLRDEERRREAGAPPARPPAGPAHPAAAARALRRLIAAAVVVIVAMTTVGFVVLPRMRQSEVSSELLTASSSTTGFNDEVALGQEGVISESDQAVMDVVISRRVDGDPVGLGLTRLYLRGAALDIYENGAWRSQSDRSTSTSTISSDETRRLWRVEEASTVYEMRAEFINRSTSQIFSMANPISIAFDRSVRLRIDRRDQTMAAETDGLLTYTVSASPDGVITDRRAISRRLPAQFEEGSIRDEAGRLMEEFGLQRDPEQRFTDQDEAIARAFEEHLRRRCVYTTNMAPTRDGEDPIEMFLFRTQAGHCEYFASSMTAMLRSMGMDARVVTGYVVDAERLAAERFTVRENDAHAWVEAQVAPGVWKTFDPSPPAQVDALRSNPTGIAAIYRSVKETMQDLWARRVIGYNHDAQTEALGGFSLPVEERLRGTISRLGRGLRASPLNALVSALLSGVIVFVVTAASAYAGRAGWRRFRVWLRVRREAIRAAGDDDQARRRIEQAAFYHRASGRLRRVGLGRPEWMTPMTHARRLRDIDDALSDAVAALAELYYAARFGGRWLSAEEREQADARLAAMDARLRELRPGPIRRAGDLSA